MLSSGFYPTEVQGKLRAPMQIEQWDTRDVSPIGYRHYESGVFKPAAKGTLRLVPDGLRGGFQAQKESGVAINFGQPIANNNGFYTDTVALTMNMGEINFHPDSFFNLATGVANNFKAFNMRFWINNYGAFSGICNGSGIPTFYYLASNTWQRNIRLRDNTAGVQVVPSSMPDSQNLFSKATNSVFISGAYKETEFSHFLYLVGKFPSGCNYPLGTYGGLGQGDFTFRFSYDWTDITANVRLSDGQDCNV